MIRHGTPDDAPRCQQIARQHRAALPFVSLPSLRERANKRELFIAERDGVVVGFVSWHKRRDGWSTIYEIAVDKSAQGTGVGRQLLYAVPTPLRLKCPADIAANKFYQGAGLHLERTEAALVCAALTRAK